MNVIAFLNLLTYTIDKARELKDQKEIDDAKAKANR